MTAKENGGSAGKKPVAKKTVAPPKAAKAPKPPKAPKAPKKGVTKEQAQAAHTRLKEGKSSLIAESKKLGFSHNGPLRAALRDLIGVEKYNALMGPKPKAEKVAKVKGEKKPAAPKAPAKPKAEKKAVAPKADAPAAAPPAVETAGTGTEGAS